MKWLLHIRLALYLGSGAIGFAAAKATDPGAGATCSLEAQQPIGALQ